MFTMPAKAVSLWLNSLYVSIIDPDRARDTFKRTNKFSDPSFLEKVEALSNTVDRLVLKASFLPDLKEIKDSITNAPGDVIDVLIFRFHWKMAELDTEPGDLCFPDNKPDILAAFRLFLIFDPDIRNAPWPTN